MRTLAIIILTFTALTLAASAKAADTSTQTRPCSIAAYPRLHAVLVDYGQMTNWRHECGKHPRIIHRLLTTGCNRYECNYANGLAYRRWIRHFTIRHGGIPGGDLILGA